MHSPLSSDDPDPASGLEIVVQNSSGARDLDVRALRPWLHALVTDLAPWAGSLGVLFAGDRRLAALNEQYRGKVGPTDVLSFPGEEHEIPGGHLGDIAISVATARRQALAAGHSLEREVRVLILHGVLHTLGFDHEVDDGEMEQLEAHLRTNWIPDHG